MRKFLSLKKRICATCDYWDSIERRAFLRRNEVLILTERMSRQRCMCPKNKMEKRGVMERCNEWRRWRPKSNLEDVQAGTRRKKSDASVVFDSDVDAGGLSDDIK